MNAPLFATFLLGMFWKRATGHGAFIGLLAGTPPRRSIHGLTIPSGRAIGHQGRLARPVAAHLSERDGAEFLDGDVRLDRLFRRHHCVSLATRRNKTDEELKGLVYSLTPKYRDNDLVWYKRPIFLGVLILAVDGALYLIFW